MVYKLKGHNAIPRYSVLPKGKQCSSFSTYTLKVCTVRHFYLERSEAKNNEPRISAKKNKPQTIFEMPFSHFAASPVRSSISFYFIAVCVPVCVSVGDKQHYFMI